MNNSVNNCKITYNEIVLWLYIMELTRFKIRPAGVESKKDIGARNTFVSIFKNIFCPAARPNVATSTALININQELPKARDI